MFTINLGLSASFGTSDGSDPLAAGKRYDLVVGGMLLIGLIGLTLDTLFARATRFARVD